MEREEIKSKIKDLFVNRYRARGYPMPVLIQTDECCKDRALITEILNEIGESDSRFNVQLSGASPNTSEPMPFPEIPMLQHSESQKSNQNLMHVYVQSTSDQMLKTYVGLLIDELRKSRNLYV